MERVRMSAEQLCKSFTKRDYSSLSLSDFIIQADNFNSKSSDVDIIKEYLHVSGNCKEILLMVKEIPALDLQIVFSIMKVLCHILVRVASDLHIFSSVGIAIVNEILAYGMKAINYFLKAQKGTDRTTLALHLLSSMVALGGQTANKVASKLDFSSTTFTQLLNRRRYSAEEDIRTTFINLIIFILTNCDSNIIQRLVEIKGFLNSILADIISDKVSVITSVLSTFRKVIVENPAISKTTKLRLFNEYSLKSIIQLYTWQGPIRVKKGFKRKLGDSEQHIAYEVPKEDAESVHRCAHEFMLYLCTSFKTGIVFFDPSYGTSGKNLNSVLTNLLLSMQKPHGNKLMTEFVVTVFKVCPDQIIYYLPHFKDSLMPRISTLWVDAVNMIKQIILSQDPVSCLFQSQEKKSVSTLITIASNLCTGNLISIFELSNIFKEGNAFICYHLCDLLSCMLFQVKRVSDFCLKGVSKTIYSSTDISTFMQAFLSSICQELSFLKEIEEFWGKLTSVNLDNCEEINEKGLIVPALSDQLLKILEVIHQFQFVAHHCCYVSDINTFKFFQCVKELNNLSQEEKSNIYVKIVDIFAIQGEQNVVLWSKNLADSPLTVLIDVYLSSPSSKLIEDVLNIFHKMLMYTKVFDHCSWEINIWLESMRTTKAKHIPYVIEFINDTMCTLLQNPNMFFDEILENTFGTMRPQSSSFDMMRILNDLLSTKEELVWIEEFEENKYDSLSEKHCFSSLVPAALYTLKTVDSHKRKACRNFVEKVLYSVMHRQKKVEIFFSVIKKYSKNISSSLCDYFECLCLDSYGKKVLNDEHVVITCKEDMSEHLKANFLTRHASKNSQIGCHCNIQFNPEELTTSCKEKVIWQLLMYIDFEISLILENTVSYVGSLKYLNILENILKSFKQSASETINNAIGKSTFEQTKSLKNILLNEILDRPFMLKLFLFAENVPKLIRTLVKDLVNVVTNLVLNIASEVLFKKSYNNNVLAKFKAKLLKFISLLLQANFPKKTIMYKNFEIYNVVESFSSLFSPNDVIYVLEDLLHLDIDCKKFEHYFPTLLLVLKMYISFEDPIILSGRAINMLLVRYINLSKKEQDALKEYVLNIFDKHPIAAYAVNTDSCYSLLKPESSNSIYVLGSLIDSCHRIKQEIQQKILDNYESLKDSSSFINLVSKCIVNRVLNDPIDLNFQEKIFMLYWESVNNYLLSDNGTSSDLLKNNAICRAIQIICHGKFLSKKKLVRFFKMHKEDLNMLPHSSKLTIFLCLLDIVKDYLFEHSKNSRLVLRIIISWIFDAISSVKNSSAFEYFPLLHFAKKFVQDIPEDDFTDNIMEYNTFIPKLLKVSFKHQDVGLSLIEILTLFCKKCSNIPSTFIFNLITGHSSFCDVMLTENSDERLKECIIDLLIILVDIDNSVCKDAHLGLFLASYTGTLKLVDQKLLYLIKLYSGSAVDISKFRPFIWGKAAIAHYSVMNSDIMHLWKKPKLQDVLNLFLFEKIKTTTEKYPLTLKLEPSICDLNSTVEDARNMYDLRFVLPLFADLLSPGSYVHCQSFINSKVLMMLFTSLSCLDPNTRALGYYCLAQLYGHLESANYGEKQIWLALLDSLRNSITSENSKVPSIVTLFLARTTDIFTIPAHPLFNVVSNFIMVKPNLDIGHVPEFYRLFNSIEIKYKVHRMWLLQLLADGLHSSLDFHICEKRYIFSTLLTFYASSLSSQDEKIAVLRILSAAVSIETSAKILCQNAFLPWLLFIFNEVNNINYDILNYLCTLMKNLWNSGKIFCSKRFSEDQVGNSSNEKTEDIQNNFFTSFPKDFLEVLLNFLKKIELLSFSAINVYLSTLLDVIIFIKSNKMTISTTDMSVKHISQLLYSWQAVAERTKSQKEETSKYYESEFKECCVLFGKIILQWTPAWNDDVSEQVYNYQITCILKVVEFILQFQDLSSYYMNDLPAWLHTTFMEDKKGELAKLFLSLKGESCLKLILRIFEKSLNYKSKIAFTAMQNQIQSCESSKEYASNYWEEIISTFKKVCKTYNLTPELNLYHEITILL